MEGEGAGSYLQVHWPPLSHILLVYGVVRGEDSCSAGGRP